MVEIKQDTHYTHDRNNQEVFTLKIKKHSEHAMSYACSYTIAELREIVDEITVFLEGRDNERNTAN